MRTTSIWFIALLSLLISSTMTHAQTYDNLWKQVEKADQQSLPKTAVKLTEDIYRKAETEKNSAQMLKAYTARSAYRQQIAPDSFYIDLKRMEQWAAGTTIHEDCAILHTLIARIYSDYARDNQYQLRRRINVDDAPAEDIREWSGIQFVRKVLDHTQIALEDSALLVKLSSKAYVPFVIQNDDSRYYQHNMYQLLASYGITALRQVKDYTNGPEVKQAIVRIFSNLNHIYRAQDNKDALVLVALDGLEWRKYEDGLSAEDNLSTLDGLIAAYGDRPICAEVYLAKATALVEQDKKKEAYQICQDAMAKYPKYRRINALKSLQEAILQPDLSVTADATVYPGDTLDLNVSHVNLDGFTVELLKVKLPATSPILSRATAEKYYKQYTEKISSHHYSLIRPDDYLQKDTVFHLVAPKDGIYTLRIIPDSKVSDTSNRMLSVTPLKVLSHTLPGKQSEAVVLDANSGHPVADATIHLFVNNKGNAQLSQSLKVGADGRVVFPWNNDYVYIMAENKSGSSTLLQRIYAGYYGFHEDRKEHEGLRLLTDRAIYRPGQTVYVKGIAFTQESDTANVAIGKTFILTLTDPNYKEISQQKLTTNDFGSFTAEFILPSGGLNGTYTLRSSNANINIRVEEYKRPTFDITFEKQEDSYKLGDAVQVKGTVKTFSGVPVQDLPVEYVVTRRLFGWWGGYFGVETTLDSGTATLNEKGEFVLPVTLEAEKEKKNGNNDQGFYAFTISATVTNVAGETQTTSTTLAAGSRSLMLSAEIPEQINKDDSISLIFNARNLNSQPITVKGEYKLYPFADYPTRKAATDPVITGTFTSNIQTELPAWKSLPSGAYKLVISALDNQGRKVDFEAETILFSIQDKRPAVDTGAWYYPVNLSFDAAHPAEFIFGSSKKDTYVLMDVFSGNKRLESRSLHLSDSVMHFTYPYKAEYGDGVTIAFCFVKDGEIYNTDVEMQKRLPEKELKLTWSVFRDKLRPGQQEEWKLTIQNPDGSFANAELLATMYDASLDKIWKRPQGLEVYYPLHTPSSYWIAYDSNMNYFRFWFKRTATTYPAMEFDTFWMPQTAEFTILSGAIAGVQVRSMSARKDMIPAVEDSDNELLFFEEEAKMDMAIDEENAGGALPESTAELRTNFAETAFFYPQLRTNEKGEVVIAFTLPESLTRWNFNGYAHTKGMLTGTISSEAVASKEFMLTPNLPRFVRVGDNTGVAASVANLTENSLSGQVVFTLFDPLTEKVIATQKQKFTAEAGKTIGVDFTFTATDKYELLGCRIVAEGGQFSDGEQHLLPVLSNKERIIETIAMPVRGNQTGEFSLANLFNKNSKTATNRSLTIEFSGNPAWYAVQALPSLSLPTQDNAISWATAYYANSLASYIANSQPRIKAVFDAWKKQGGTKETFLSNLQKNQDVRNILLEESPWIMEANTEQEQKERIATLFDLNNIQNNNITALNKLKDLQLASGAWTWYKGMTGSRYITNYIMSQLLRLPELTGNKPDGDVLAMRNAGFNFLHQEALNEYEEIRRAEKKGTKFNGISGSALQYLYFIAISGESVPAKNKEAYNYFLGKVKETISTQSITQKALAAIILHKAGRTAEAQAFIASLKEFTTQTDEQGMFFAFNENPYTWGGLKVPAHVTVMEALDIVGNHAAEVEEMKLWLLKQKQTQQWNSPVSTANAVYALLNRGTSLVDSQGDVRITLGNKVIETLSPSEAGVPGLSYIKETITDKNTLSKARKIVVEKQDAGIAWGAVYAQFEEDIDKVTSHGEGLNVEKKLYVERISGNKKELVPITADSQLKVGDKVVSRITIRLDHAMDFVQLKDQRGACFEPLQTISGYVRNSGTGYYVAVKDASTNFFFDSLGKGVYVLEYGYRVSRTGTYEGGLAIIQSAYAPEYAAHSNSIKLRIEN